MLELHEFEPAAMEPIGDRYVVETLFVEETVQFGSLLVYMPQEDIDPKNPGANPKMEKRGVLPAVIIAIGNGHLLGLPDPRLIKRDGAGMDTVVRETADVPMFLKVGDVVLVDINYKGKALKIADREIRVLNQMDCLVKLPVRLVWTDEGWKREDKMLEAENTSE
jgi:co-chaperonin GroES (HSP10)